MRELIWDWLAIGEGIPVVGLKVYISTADGVES